MSTYPTPAGPTLRRATLDDRGALMAFYASHHGQRPRLNDPALWNWEFVDTPTATDALPFFILADGERIVGGIGYIAVTLKSGERAIAAALPVNYFIDPAYKGLPALRLLRAVQGERDILIGSYISDDALRLLTKAGFTDLSVHVRAWHYPLHIDWRRPRSLATQAWRRTAELLRRARAAVSGRGLAHRVLNSVDDFELDVFTTMRGAVHVAKTRAWLHWRYQTSPVLQPLYVLQSDGGTTCGLAVLHIDRTRNQCIILDIAWTGAPDTAKLIALVDAVIAAARERHCAMLTTHALSPLLGDVLQRCYFASQLSHLGMVVLARKEPDRSELTDPRRWHFMLGDTDAY